MGGGGILCDVIWGGGDVKPNSTGKVKVDLANFDVKFRTKFLYVKFVSKLTYSCRNVLQIFLNF
jgi:hypothetical protein